ncbi:prolyl 4-hydroxylase subunit alpha-1-like isoform X2 [Convolutriloba macropyga]
MTFDVKFPNVLKRNCKRLSCLTGKQCKAHTSVSLKYADLCAGGQKYTQKFHKLQCDNWSPHPSFYLQPIRREWLNKRPNLFVIYDLMNSTEADLLWRLAPFAERSVVMNEAGTKSTQETRTGITAWLSDMTPEVAAVSSRIGHILTKDMRFSESYQIANYGIGGHYYIHHDYFTEEALKNLKSAIAKGWSNRLITMVVYLSDVLEGGNTVFPKLDIAVAPRKGSAVVWENLRSDGTPYEETLHAGCPVLIGSKK